MIFRRIFYNISFAHGYFFCQGGRFHVRGRTGNDNSGILTCADDNNEIQAENIRQESNGRDQEPGIYPY